MDVTCERCGTEYEFDETLVSERGTTVKCTQCGHLFKVYRPGGGASEPWRVQRGDGRVESVATLRELQRLITRGELTEDDLISRGSEGWKRLGDIAELSGFFRAARRAAARAVDSTVPFDRTLPAMPGVEPGALDPQGSPAQAAWEAMPTVPGGRTYKRTAMGLGAPQPIQPPAQPPAQPTAGSSPSTGTAAARPDPTPSGPVATEPAAPQAPTNPERPAARRVPTGAVPTPDGGWAEGPGLGAQAGPAASPALPRLEGQSAAPPPQAAELPRLQDAPAQQAVPSATPPRVEPTDPVQGPPSELPEVPGLSRRGSALKWLAVLLLLGGVGTAGYLGRDRILGLLQGAQGTRPDPVARFLEAGDRALAEDHPDAYERALREYTKATAVAEADPRVLARMAQAEALHALALELRASDLRARAEKDPTRLGEARALQAEAKRRLQQAEETLQRIGTAAKAASMPEVLVARAMVAFVAERGEAGDAALSSLRALGDGVPAGSVEWLEALRTVDPKEGVPARALEPARRAVERAPESVRAKLLLARAALAARRIEEASEALDAVLERFPDHPEAKALKRAIEAGLPPAPALLERVDGGVPKAPDAGTSAARPEEGGGSAVAQAGSGQARGEERRGGAGEPSGAGTREAVGGQDYDALVRKGEQLQERGRSAEARRYFERALQVRPNGPEALVGLGYVALDERRSGEALGHFRRAAARGYGEGYLGLGEVYESMGRYQEALEAYRGYLQRNASGPSAVIARRKVAELEQRLGARSAEPGAADTPGDVTASPSPSGAAGPAGSPPPGASPETAPESGGAASEEPATEQPAAPPTSAGELPAPRGASPNDLPAADPPAVDSEP